MNQDIFENLPSEIVINILSRLPVRSVTSCKCVQKSWFHLLETQEFVKSHLSKSVQGLMMRKFKCSGISYKLFEFGDAFDVEDHDLDYKLVTKFSANLGVIEGSVDGLLLLCDGCDNPAALYICNPITRDYINLDWPPKFQDSGVVDIWGFGSSKITSQYKVVRISHDFMSNQKTQKGQKTFEVECHIYTLGTGLWRRCASSCALLVHPINGEYVNINLHWLVCDLDDSLRISCFDLETEHFSTLSPPCPLHLNRKSESLYMLNLFAFGDCLGLCDNSSDDETVIWLMKEYGVERSWTKEIVISNGGWVGPAYPIKVFKNGDVLIQSNESSFFYYSSKTKTTQKVDETFTWCNKYHNGPFLHTPSFLSLKSFGLDVSSF